MAAQILPFPKPGAGAASPLACFIRVGEAHNRLADLHAAGHLPARQVVIEASRFRHQREPVSALRESGAEIVLDAEAAERAAPARFAGHSRYAPWASPDGPLGPDHFRETAPGENALTGFQSVPPLVMHSAQRSTGRVEVTS